MRRLARGPISDSLDPRHVCIGSHSAYSARLLSAALLARSGPGVLLRTGLDERRGRHAAADAVRSCPSAIEVRRPGYTPQTSCEPFAKPGTLRLATAADQHLPGDPLRHRPGVRVDAEQRALRRSGGRLDGLGPQFRATGGEAEAVLEAGCGPPTPRAERLRERPPARRDVPDLEQPDLERIYSADEGWRAYSDCADHPETARPTARCHRNHIHFSLSWEGARGVDLLLDRGRSPRPDFGPCRPADLNWAARYSAVQPHPLYRATRRSRPRRAPRRTLRTLITYSGSDPAAKARPVSRSRRCRRWWESRPPGRSVRAPNGP